MSMIEVREVSKDYRILQGRKGFWGSIHSLAHPLYVIKRAVDSIDFSIERGEMVGFIGPNGAGKSTTVKMLSGILHPTAGSITVAGLVPYKNRQEHVRRIGVVFGQKSQLWWDLPISDTFDLLRYIYKIPDVTFRKNMELFQDLLGIGEFAAQPVRQLSLGQRMRADIAAALIHDPEIIFFDEPTIGLDIVAKERIREFVKVINQERGTTMLFTTHDMQDIEKTCQRVIIIDKGIKMYDGSVAQIKQRYGKKRALRVEFSQAYGPIRIPNAEVIDESPTVKRIVFPRDTIQIHNLISSLTAQYQIADLTIQEPEIESIIREIYEGDIEIDESVS